VGAFIPVDRRIEQIVRRALPNATITRIAPFGVDDAQHESREATVKALGYGAPLRIDLESTSCQRTLVLHQVGANPFGHNRRADRAAEILLSADTFGLIPGHVRALDVGAYDTDGSSISLAKAGEFYLLTEYAAGRLYAEDLRQIASAGSATQQDCDRASALARYLATLHRERLADPVAYQRAVRDLLGSGEGIFGIADAYPDDVPGAPRSRLYDIERRCLEWRWELKSRSHRAARIHGDFHPFNVLFDDHGAIVTLDASRGCAGDPADDVSAMAINYVFFALQEPGSWATAFAPLWRRFWREYADGAQDDELYELVAPFLTWRALVLACPLWYPGLSADARSRLLTFAEAALDASRFTPELAESVFR
jgi:hypothetical protein